MSTSGVDMSTVDMSTLRVDGAGGRARAGPGVGTWKLSRGNLDQETGSRFPGNVFHIKEIIFREGKVLALCRLKIKRRFRWIVVRMTSSTRPGRPVDKRGRDTYETQR